MSSISNQISFRIVIPDCVNRMHQCLVSLYIYHSWAIACMINGRECVSIEKNSHFSSGCGKVVYILLSGIKERAFGRNLWLKQKESNTCSREFKEWIYSAEKGCLICSRRPCDPSGDHWTYRTGDRTSKYSNQLLCPSAQLRFVFSWVKPSVHISSALHSSVLTIYKNTSQAFHGLLTSPLFQAGFEERESFTPITRTEAEEQMRAFRPNEVVELLFPNITVRQAIL